MGRVFNETAAGGGFGRGTNPVTFAPAANKLDLDDRLSSQLRSPFSWRTTRRAPGDEDRPARPCVKLAGPGALFRSKLPVSSVRPVGPAGTGRAAQDEETYGGADEPETREIEERRESAWPQPRRSVTHDQESATSAPAECTKAMNEPTQRAPGIAAWARRIAGLLHGERRVLETVRRDHVEVVTLLERVVHTGARGRGLRLRKALFERIRLELMAHDAAERRTLYPALRSTGSADILVEDCLDDHHHIERLLEQLSALRPDDSDWLPLVLRLGDTVEHHILDEERRVFPALEQACSPEALADLDGRFRRERDVARQRLRAMTRAFARGREPDSSHLAPTPLATDEPSKA